MRYRRKPTEIEAVQWDGTSESGTATNALCPTFSVEVGGGATIKAGKGGAQGWVDVPVGHWVAKAADDDFYPIDPDVFAATYEAVDE